MAKPARTQRPLRTAEVRRERACGCGWMYSPPSYLKSGLLGPQDEKPGLRPYTILPLCLAVGLVGPERHRGRQGQEQRSIKSLDAPVNFNWMTAADQAWTHCTKTFTNPQHKPCQIIFNSAVVLWQPWVGANGRSGGSVEQYCQLEFTELDRILLTRLRHVQRSWSIQMTWSSASFMLINLFSSEWILCGLLSKLHIMFASDFVHQPKIPLMLFET